MEKRETGKTITIKINGKHQAFEESRQKSDRKKSPLIDDRVEESPLERVTINGSPLPNLHGEEAAGEEKIDDDFDWILPESVVEPDSTENKLGVKPKKENKKSAKKAGIGKLKMNRGVFATIFTAVFLAVLLGTSFGFTMLKLVFIEKPAEISPAKETSTQPQTQKNPVQNQSGTLSLVLPAISTWVVQEGAYTNKESAKQMEATLKEKGLSASVFETSERSFLLLSVADTKDHAKEIGATLKVSIENEPYPKEVSVGGKEITGLNEQEKMFLSQLPLLFESMSKAAAADSPSQTLVNNVNEQSKKLEATDDIQNERIKAIMKDTEAAVKNINAYHKSGDKKELTSLQQHLLSILAAYQAL
ncbi:SPOR domain-containing protein [Neobacillus sp. LXY-4]|uniref:SPOR domain-containing protein n=1 Tax=Neobacillus sp. LXY-4 TaxID=3379826 RepID=UPI003EE35F3D